MIEEQFRFVAEGLALAIEALVVLILAWGAARAAFGLARVSLKGEDILKEGRSVWLSFAVLIVLALEFALAADIIRTAIAPTWDAVGKLAAIAGIRTALNLFLMRDIEGQAEKKA
jgi:uncharacterized membrane protein